MPRAYSRPGLLSSTASFRFLTVCLPKLQCGPQLSIVEPAHLSPWMVDGILHAGSRAGSMAARGRPFHRSKPSQNCKANAPKLYSAGKTWACTTAEKAAATKNPMGPGGKNWGLVNPLTYHTTEHTTATHCPSRSGPQPLHQQSLTSFHPATGHL